MVAVRHKVIHAGLQVLHGTKAHKLAAPMTRGRGVILTFHHVRPWEADAFAPNRLLEITPTFLDTVLYKLKALGYRVVPLGEVPSLLERPPGKQPFAVLTFDDGYRDLFVHALPVLEKHAAPFTAFITTGFADRTASPWWLELEALLRIRHELALEMNGSKRAWALRSLPEKQKAFAAIAGHLLRWDDGRLLVEVRQLCRRERISGRALVDRLCLDWAELVQLSRHTLCTIGCHTMSHPRLSGLGAADLRSELAAARQLLERRLGRPVDHLCYPYGSRAAAGPREFRLASELGFQTAVTTRPGVLFPSHRAHLTALPRVSVNGLWQSEAALDVLLSGAGFAVWRCGRRLDLR